MHSIQLDGVCHGMTMVAAVLISFFAGCANSSRTLPAAAELVMGGQVPSQVSEDALRRGRTLAITECATCHRFYWPEEYSPEEWTGIIQKMGQRASLTQNQIEDVQSYFSAASRAARKTVPADSDT